MERKLYETVLLLQWGYLQKHPLSTLQIAQLYGSISAEVAVQMTYILAGH